MSTAKISLSRNPGTALVDELRAACAWVAGRSALVRIVPERIPSYAQTLTSAPAPAPVRTPTAPAKRETEAAHWLTLDAINFGSGWFPTLRKGAQPTGYRTIAAGIDRRFAQAGRWRAAELAELSATELAGWLDQDPEHELIALMAGSLQDLGANVRRLYGGSFAAVVDAAGGSAIALVETLASWRCFADSSSYDGRTIPFLKRAQIAAADLHRNGVAQFHDMDRLTMFADNLVPHVLRLDGVLWFEPELVARIERGELIEHGSPEEVEIRACAVHAVELLAAAAPSGATAAQIDQILWNRGQQPRYKAAPRHRSRSSAY
jgi:hypothetical protein